MTNPSAQPLTIDSILFSDSHFRYTGLLKAIIPPQSTRKIFYSFTPTAAGPYRAKAELLSNTFGTEYVSVSACTIPAKAGVTIGDRMSASSAQTELFPAHPNPSNSTTNHDIILTIGLRERAAISLIIYDLLGRECIVVSRDPSHPKGLTDFHVDASKLDPGSYVYRL